jgi:hypothetical protein
VVDDPLGEVQAELPKPAADAAELLKIDHDARTLRAVVREGCLGRSHCFSIAVV